MKLNRWLICFLILSIFILNGCAGHAFVPVPSADQLANIQISSNILDEPEPIHDGDEILPAFTISGNSLQFLHIANHPCDRSATIEEKIEGNMVILYETWKGRAQTATCNTEIHVTLKNLPPGAYLATVYERGVLPDGFTPMPLQVIASVDLAIQ